VRRSAPLGVTAVFEVQSGGRSTALHFRPKPPRADSPRQQKRWDYPYPPKKGCSSPRKGMFHTVQNGKKRPLARFVGQAKSRPMPAQPFTASPLAFAGRCGGVGWSTDYLGGVARSLGRIVGDFLCSEVTFCGADGTKGAADVTKDARTKLRTRRTKPRTWRTKPKDADGQKLSTRRQNQGRDGQNQGRARAN
jgi:hypothetical protein